jgi:hypothetical protein
VPAGVYDVLYRRNWTSSSNSVYRTQPGDTPVNGHRILQASVNLAAGTNTLNVDIPVARVSGTITLAGAALPATHTDYDGADIYLVAKDTGAAHSIGGYSYQYQSPGVYALRTGTYGGKVPAGIYDTLYRRNWTASSRTVYRTLATEAHVNGYPAARRMRGDAVSPRSESAAPCDSVRASASPGRWRCLARLAPLAELHWRCGRVERQDRGRSGRSCRSLP